MELVGQFLAAGKNCSRSPTQRVRGSLVVDFFTSNICNRHTCEAYGRAVNEFLGWCEAHGVHSLADVEPLHVAAWIEAQTLVESASTVKQRLAAIRYLFDWLGAGSICGAAGTPYGLAVNRRRATGGNVLRRRPDDTQRPHRNYRAALKDGGLSAFSVRCSLTTHLNNSVARPLTLSERWG